jgi:hypothetical protein
VSGDLFLVRHDTDGTHLWSTAFTPTGGFASADVVAADASGRIFVGGTLYGFGGDATIDFGGGPLSGNNALYLAGFDAAGGHLFSRVVGPGSWRDLATGGGRVVGTGYTYGSVDFGGGAVGGAGGSDAFVGCVDAAGAHQWSTAYGDGGDQGGMGVAVDAAGAVALAATTTGGIDFGGGTLTPTTTVGLCLVRLDATGSHQWSRIFDGAFSGGGGILAVLDLDISADGDVALGGQMNGSCDFGGGALTSNGQGDAFLAVYDAAGIHQWSAAYGGSVTDFVSGVAFDASGGILVAGNFLSTNCSFGGGSFTPSGFGADFFVAHYDAAGAHQWSAAYGANGQWRIGVGIPTDGTFFLWGNGAAELDFGGGPLAAAQLFHAELEGAGAATDAAPLRPGARLEQNLPNPFNPVTTIRFHLAAEAPVRLEVYDVAGRRLSVLLRRVLPAGEHRVIWDGRDDRGGAVASGTYFYRLVAGEQVLSRTMILVK